MKIAEAHWGFTWDPRLWNPLVFFNPGEKEVKVPCFRDLLSSEMPFTGLWSLALTLQRASYGSYYY